MFQYSEAFGPESLRGRSTIKILPSDWPEGLRREAVRLPATGPKAARNECIESGDFNIRKKYNPVAMQIVRKKPRFFYGWVMLAIATVASIMSTPGQTAGVSLFTPSFEAALGLSRTQQTGAYAMGTFLASLIMTYVGAQMDRLGIRKVMGIVVVCFGLVCFYTGFVTGFWTLFIAFLFLRMFGQGALSLLSQNTAAMWFDKRLGMANAVTGIGFSLAAAGMPFFVLWLLDLVDWRVAYPILGLIVVVVMMPLILFFYVDRPEDIGQLLDGGWSGAANAIDQEPAVDFTLQQAMQTPTYWIVTGMMFSISMIVTGFTFNALFLFAEYGLTDLQTGSILATIGITMSIAQLPAGWLADRMSLRWLGVISMVGQTASMVLLLFINSMWMATAFAVLSGVITSLYGAMGGTLWPRYFGREHLGKIRGSVFTAQVAGSSLGPFVMGSLFDLTGSYSPSIIIFIVIYGIFSILAPFAWKPQLPHE